ncbi:glycosyltransferase [Geodermatophilus nigrescens]|uniref:Putative rhamnosyl transferase n=1 Tax=Geodermatophilus nigrescens TaxID=1070870 RepID=A0A1M5E4Y2_9ACTN|nr:glycosyltransferase [Geodermatophilus nigrescens]SHF74297.1 Putative rhamnosyl transferase [Geodermatophilus nigrescens]
MTAPGTHALLTRFNLPSRGHESLVRAQEDWLRNRVELFERHCLPSVLAQTRQDFSWLVYLDPASPRWLLEWVDGHRRSGHFTALFREEVPRADLLADIRAAAGHRPGDLLTTNLDNDDGLARDFVARIQDAAVPSARAALYVGDGLIVRGDRVYRRLDRYNAFCSVRESWDAPVTCWSDWHTGLADHMPAVVLRGDPGWLQVVHGGNVSNRVRGRRTRPSAHAAAFPGLPEDLPDPGRGALTADALAAGPVRAVREGGRAAAKSVVHAVLGREALDRVKYAAATVRHRSRSQETAGANPVTSSASARMLPVDGAAGLPNRENGVADPVGGRQDGGRP